MDTFPPPSPATARRSFKRRLDKYVAAYMLGYALFVLLMALLEQMGLPRKAIGVAFLLSTVAVYAVIGMVSRTTVPVEYYVAGRRVPAMYNGMATAADWMSAASFIGLAGTLYLSGYGGLAFVLGWTGGFCLVALFVAPYLRKFGQYTVPDFLGERYGSDLTRSIALFGAILCSFTYVVAQIYGVGLITTRLSGLPFEIGVFAALGSILLCSFLGGMRAVTWTQVAQYIVIIVAYLVPVVWLSVKQTGVPLPTAVYGQQLQKISALERKLLDDPREAEVAAAFRARAAALDQKLRDVPAALAAERETARQRLERSSAGNGPLLEVQRASRALAALPRDAAEATRAWSAAKAQNEARAAPLAGMPPHAQAFAGDPNGEPAAKQQFDHSRRNFLALVFCLMMGTAALPHILVRYYTTPTVRQARESVTWSLLLIVLLYLTAPALAVLVKYEIFSTLVGTPFDRLPAWIAHWSKLDPALLSVADVNGDGVLQLGEMRIGADIIVLATPEIAGLPYVVSAMVAAGGLAAALSTADGLLLTISNSLGHDLYYKMINPQVSTTQRVTLSKALMLLVAVAAAAVTAQRPPDLLVLVSAAFSLAAATFFPALVLGVFWPRANAPGAAAGMLAGLTLTAYYIATTDAWVRALFGASGPVELWWGIQPASAAVFGVPAGFAVIVIVSLLTQRPGPQQQALVQRIRYPADAAPGDARR
ncbi:MAG TPA: cation acetate symporter [Rubrivivax sp.]|nr:cation acetate symporter [Rubrivivax sp.]